MKSLQQTLQGRSIGRYERQMFKLAALVMTGVLLDFPLARVKASRPTEYEVKAAYLYNFGRFVQWPPKANGNDRFPICVLGQDPFGRILDATVGGETINGMKVVTQRISTPQDALSCRVLFISSSEDMELKGILSALDDSSVLTVSDMPQFTQRGGMIHFITRSGRIHFEINLAAAGRVGLALSSQLLKLAVSVVRNLPGEN